MKARLGARLLIVAQRLDTLGGSLVPATVLDVVLRDVEIDPIGVNARDDALGNVVLVREDQPLFEPEIVPEGNSPADLAQLLARHIVDGRSSRNTQVSTGLVPTHRGWIVWIVLPHLVVTVVHGWTPFRV